jgi:hypothetical protein
MCIYQRSNNNHLFTEVRGAILCHPLLPRRWSSSPPEPTLKTLSKAKQPYRSPIGYATSSRWSDIRSTATNIPDAAYVHQIIESMESRYPIVPLGEEKRQPHNMVDKRAALLKCNHDTQGTNSYHRK